MERRGEVYTEKGEVEEKGEGDKGPSLDRTSEIMANGPCSNPFLVEYSVTNSSSRYLPLGSTSSSKDCHKYTMQSGVRPAVR